MKWNSCINIFGCNASDGTHKDTNLSESNRIEQHLLEQHRHTNNLCWLYRKVVSATIFGIRAKVVVLVREEVSQEVYSIHWNTRTHTRLPILCLIHINGDWLTYIVVCAMAKHKCGKLFIAWIDRKFMQGAQSWSVVFLLLALKLIMIQIYVSLATRHFPPASIASLFSHSLAFFIDWRRNAKKRHGRESERAFELKHQYIESANHQVRMIFSLHITATRADTHTQRQ